MDSVILWWVSILALLVNLSRLISNFFFWGSNKNLCLVFPRAFYLLLSHGFWASFSQASFRGHIIVCIEFICWLGVSSSIFSSFLGSSLTKNRQPLRESKIISSNSLRQNCGFLLYSRCLSQCDPRSAIRQILKKEKKRKDTRISSTLLKG